MATEYKKYSKMFVAVNGANALEAVSIQLTLNSNASMVKSIALGMCGTTDGSPDAQFSMEFNVPAAAFEKDWSKVLSVNSTVTFEFRVAGMSCILDKATVQTCSYSFAEGGNVQMSISGFSAYSEFNA